MAAKAWLWRVPIAILAIAVLTLFFETAGVFSWAATELHAWRSDTAISDSGQKEVWVEVHDVSASYGSKPLLEIIDVLDRHPNSYKRAVLLVIPNHGGSAPLRKYPEFAGLLSELEGRDYALGVHGYAHPDPLRGREFEVEVDDAQALMNAALEEFNASGLGRPTVFAPPGWGASQGASDLLRGSFDYVYHFYYIDYGGLTLPYEAHEYTWYKLNPGLKKAQLDYARTKGVFRLSVHVGAANSEENLKFLDDFLSYVESGG